MPKIIYIIFLLAICSCGSKNTSQTTSDSQQSQNSNANNSASTTTPSQPSGQVPTTDPSPTKPVVTPPATTTKTISVLDKIVYSIPLYGDLNNLSPDSVRTFKYDKNGKLIEENYTQGKTLWERKVYKTANDYIFEDNIYNQINHFVLSDRVSTGGNQFSQDIQTFKCTKAISDYSCDTNLTASYYNLYLIDDQKRDSEKTTYNDKNLPTFKIGYTYINNEIIQNITDYLHGFNYFFKAFYLTNNQIDYELHTAIQNGKEVNMMYRKYYYKNMEVPI